MSYPSEAQQAVLRQLYGTLLDALAHGTVAVFDEEDVPGEGRCQSSTGLEVGV